jgi:tRNA 2-selenouridine synthase
VSSNRIPAKEFFTSSYGQLIIDVRSPSEWKHAHIPGAINIPLFDDEERKVVGTAYKQESREKAIKIGLDFFAPKMRKIVEEVEERLSKLKIRNEKPETVFLYCWRGGMRSGAIAWLLDLYGFKVFVLAGGYKAYRNLVLQSFELSYPFNILGGFTGSGKTELLHEIKKAGEIVIDLEGIANHKGSAFGNIGMPEQPTQEMFENLLSSELMKASGHLIPDSVLSGTSHSQLTFNDSRIWLEDESQRIGRINLPNSLWKTIRESPVYFLEIPFEARLDHIVEEYGKLDKESLAEAIIRITKRLGPQDTKKALEFLSEGELRQCFSILLKYYDKHYLKALYNREAINGLLKKIHCETVNPGNANLLTPISHA